MLPIPRSGRHLLLLAASSCPQPCARPLHALCCSPPCPVVCLGPRPLPPTHLQGAFSACFEALHQQLAGAPAPHVHYFGKPNAAPYRLAEQLLVRQALQLGLLEGAAAEAAAEAAAGSSGSDGGAAAAAPSLPLSAIYAVGDNPAADVRGANAAGAPWVSVLVTQTGVATADCPVDSAQVVVADVEAAVEAGLHRARRDKWHSMR